MTELDLHSSIAEALDKTMLTKEMFVAGLTLKTNLGSEIIEFRFSIDPANFYVISGKRYSVFGTPLNKFYVDSYHKDDFPKLSIGDVYRKVGAIWKLVPDTPVITDQAPKRPFSFDKQNALWLICGMIIMISSFIAGYTFK